MAPALFALVPRRFTKRQAMADALPHKNWIRQVVHSSHSTVLTDLGRPTRRAAQRYRGLNGLEMDDRRPIHGQVGIYSSPLSVTPNSRVQSGMEDMGTPSSQGIPVARPMAEALDGGPTTSPWS